MTRDLLTLHIFHADSLAGPMAELGKGFAFNNQDIAIRLTAGRSKELAERILAGERCDVFCPSDPLVIADLFGREISGIAAASWYVVFSANELVVITPQGNPGQVRYISDLAGDHVKLVRVTGEKDMATGRTVEFIKKAAAAAGRPELAQTIMAATYIEAKTIPAAVDAVVTGKANAGIVYLSAAVASSDALDMILFPPEVNLSEAIRNAATIPGTAQNMNAGVRFIKYILSAAGREILKKAGQPPVVPPLSAGYPPAGIC